MSNISVIGLGYIGLPTAAILAGRGHQVLGVDVSESVLETLRKGEVHIVEPGLDIVVSGAIKSGALTVSRKAAESDVFILAVPTPFLENHAPDLSYIKAAAEAIAPFIAKGNLVVLESTSPVGATEKLSEWLGELRPDLLFPDKHGSDCNVNIAHCPERVLPGKVLQELIENDRVIGGVSAACTRSAVALYKTFVQGRCLSTSAATAEMTKLTENSFRDVNIAFANELSILAEEQGVDVWELIELANHHPRVNVLQPGPGVGGHCIAVDPWFLVSSSPENARLIRQARETNDGKPEYVINKVRNAISELERPVLACLGLSFKANIDDLRESPAVDICLRLASISGIKIHAVEPHIHSLPSKFGHHENVRLSSISEALAEADVVLLLVDHDVFREIPQMHDLSGKSVIDTRGQWRTKEAK